MAQEIEAFVSAVALALAALLPIINPLGSAPIFLSLTPGISDGSRRALARRIALNSALLLIAVMLVGSYVLNFFGLSLPVIKIAGGLLVFSTGWHLLRSDESPDTSLAKKSAASGSTEVARQSFYPLSFPLTIGPGSISVAITLGAGAREPGVPVLFSLSGSVLGILAVGTAIYLAYRYATRLLDILGDAGTIVLLRLSAFILLSVGVQILCDGLGERFAGLQ